jgi:hypothetical protein
MLHFKYFLKSLLIVNLLNLSAMANEEKTEAKHEGAAASAHQASPEFSGQQDDAWVKFQADVVSAKTKLDAEQAIVTELLVSKKNNKGRIGKDQVDQLNEHHKKLQEMVKDYNEKLNELEIKYPEKGQALGRQYSRKKEQSLDQMESFLTLDGRIRKINKKIKTQLGVEDSPVPTEGKMPETDADQKAKSKLKRAEKPTQQASPKADVIQKIIIVK